MAQATIIHTPKDSQKTHFSLEIAVAQNKNLSFEARGMLVYLLSQPSDWDVRIDDLKQQCGRNRVYKIIKELSDAGYLHRERKQKKPGGTFVWSPYFVYERPFTENAEMDAEGESTSHFPIFRNSGNGEISTQKDSKDKDKDIAPAEQTPPLQLVKPEMPFREKPIEAPKTTRKNPNEDLHHALVKAFGLDPANMTRTADRPYWSATAELRQAGITIEQIPKLHEYIKARAAKEDWNSFTVYALAKYAPEFIAGIRKAHTVLDGLTIIEDESA